MSQSSSNSNAGFDSFLDIVANLVGVMIILVVVVGANAATKWQTRVKEKPTLKAEIESRQQQLEATLTAAQKMIYDNGKLERQIVQEVKMAEQLDKQRHSMLLKLESIKAQQEKKIQTLDVQAKTKFDQATEIASLKRQLVSVQRETKALTINQQAPRETIDHYPTPIARTVFSDEVHFRLSKGRLAYVPMTELVAKMKTEWKVKAEKLKHAPRTRETVGPISGFRLQYELAARNTREQTKHGIVNGREIKFERFSMVPASDELGEKTQTALLDHSDFRTILSKFEPRKTTVSVWVYPDSYEDFAEVKTFLRESGFQTASWPLNHGKLISGGPNGFQTSAQ